MQNQNGHSAENPNRDHHVQAPASRGAEPKLPLGVGKLIGESFSILLNHILKITVGCLIPILVAIVPLFFLLSDPTAIDLENPAWHWSSVALKTIVSLVAMCGVFAVVLGFMSKLTHEATQRRKVNLRVCFKSALFAAPTIAILTLLVGVLLLIAQFLVAMLMGLAPVLSILIFLAIPALYLWVFATYCVIPPAAVIEKAGFGSLSRSAALTKGYRLRVLGTLVLAGLCSAAVQALLSIVTFLLAIAASFLSETIGSVVSVVSSMIIFGVSMGYLCIITALIYLRLREIKEGIGLEGIEAVFE